MAELVCFYSTLCQSKVRYTADSLSSYLQFIMLPQLSNSQWAFLDSPITKGVQVLSPLLRLWEMKASL